MKKIVLSVVVAATTFTAGAQNPPELIRIFESNTAFSTARSAAMGGAFTSLGADASSLDINPAGLGMYRRSEASFTGYVLSRKAGSFSERMTNNLSLPASASGSATKNNVNISNFSFVYNALNNPGRKLKALNVGFSISQQANFRSRMEAQSPYTRSSIADMFGAQLFGVSPEALKYKNSIYDGYENMPASAWGAVGAFQSGLVFDNDIVNVGGKDYVRYGPFYYDDKGVQVGSLLDGDIVRPSLSRSTGGSTVNYNFSVGGNVSDKLFLGLTLNIVSFDYNQLDIYREVTPQENRGDLLDLEYRQNLHMNGASAGVKFGMTVQPVDGLRIGAAVHSPVVMSVSEEFSTYNKNFFLGNQSYYSYSPAFKNRYKVRSAPRVTAGVSYTFGKRAILSADYEHAWYNTMDVRGIDYRPGEPTLRDEFRQNYRAAGTVKVGAEVNMGRGFMARAGYNYKMNNNKLIDNKYGAVQSFSGGLGYRGRTVFVDLAYVHARYKTPLSYYYSYTLSIPDGNDYITESYVSDSKYTTTFKDRNVALTVGVKF